MEFSIAWAPLTARYDNRIEKIERLDPVPHLRLLYLQRNRISKIEGLSHLTQLRKLYLSGNRISVVENLQGLANLRGKGARSARR